MRLFSYKMTHDSGFAPNPFWGVLTVATCKPGFRRSKRVGDWIAGFTSTYLCKDRVGQERLVYLVKIDEKMSLADYFRDPRFQCKKPKSVAQKKIYLAGDNIYEPLCPYPTTVSDFKQCRNPNHKEEHKKEDILGENVLLGTEFIYFGRNALSIPPHLRPEVPYGVAKYGVKTPDVGRARKFIEFVMAKVSTGRIHGPPHGRKPHGWPEGDESWRESR